MTLGVVWKGPGGSGITESYVLVAGSGQLLADKKDVLTCRSFFALTWSSLPGIPWISADSRCVRQQNSWITVFLNLLGEDLNNQDTVREKYFQCPVVVYSMERAIPISVML